MSSIIKSSPVIKKLLQSRFEELKLTPKQISEDAQERKMPIFTQQIYEYLNKPESKKILSEDAIIWLCIRYGISISLQVKQTPYNESDALQRLKRIFG